MTAVYIGLGSNLDQPLRQLERAVEALTVLPRSRLFGTSTLYRSRALGGPPGQPDYLNSVVLLDTTFQPLQLLRALQEIERRGGRVRPAPRWGPRTLDLDLLLYGKRRMQGPILTLPHPQIQHRAFVLHPLYELNPDLEIPGLGTVRGLLPAISDQEITRLEASPA